MILYLLRYPGASLPGIILLRNSDFNQWDQTTCLQHSNIVRVDEMSWYDSHVHSSWRPQLLQTRLHRVPSWVSHLSCDARHPFHPLPATWKSLQGSLSLWSSKKALSKGNKRFNLLQQTTINFQIFIRCFVCWVALNCASLCQDNLCATFVHCDHWWCAQWLAQAHITRQASKALASGSQASQAHGVDSPDVQSVVFFRKGWHCMALYGMVWHGMALSFYGIVQTSQQNSRCVVKKEGSNALWCGLSDHLS